MQFVPILTFKTYMIINLLLLQESEDLYCGILSQKVFVYNLQRQTAVIDLKCLKMKIKNIDMWNLIKGMKPCFIWSPGKKIITLGNSQKVK